MAYTKENKTFLSPDKTTEISYYVYTPQTTPKAIFHIIHGMCGYMEKYEKFAGFLCDNGIIVCGCDQRGHGRLAAERNELGFFGNKNGYTFFSKDNEELRKIMREKYKRLPYIMFGHSMGSLILRDYILDYGENIDGAILSGIIRSDVAMKKLKRMSGLFALLKGGKGHSEALDRAVMGDFNDEFSEGEKKENFENFTFTVKGYNDFARLMIEVMYPQYAEDILKSLPIFLICGANDSIGDKGKAVNDLYASLEDAEVNSIAKKIYDNMGHELVNCDDPEAVFADILAWTESVIEGVVACATL